MDTSRYEKCPDKARFNELFEETANATNCLLYIINTSEDIKSDIKKASSILLKKEEQLLNQKSQNKYQEVLIRDLIKILRTKNSYVAAKEEYNNVYLPLMRRAAQVKHNVSPFSWHHISSEDKKEVWDVYDAMINVGMRHSRAELNRVQSSYHQVLKACSVEDPWTFLWEGRGRLIRELMEILDVDDIEDLLLSKEEKEERVRRIEDREQKEKEGELIREKRERRRRGREELLKYDEERRRKEREERRQKEEKERLRQEEEKRKQDEIDEIEEVRWMRDSVILQRIIDDVNKRRDTEQQAADDEEREKVNEARLRVEKEKKKEAVRENERLMRNEERKQKGVERRLRREEERRRKEDERRRREEEKRLRREEAERKQKEEEEERLRREEEERKQKEEEEERLRREEEERKQKEEEEERLRREEEERKKREEKERQKQEAIEKKRKVEECLRRYEEERKRKEEEERLKREGEERRQKIAECLRHYEEERERKEEEERRRCEKEEQKKREEESRKNEESVSVASSSVAASSWTVFAANPKYAVPVFGQQKKSDVDAVSVEKSAESKSPWSVFTSNPKYAVPQFGIKREESTADVELKQREEEERLRHEEEERKQREEEERLRREEEERKQREEEERRRREEEERKQREEKERLRREEEERKQREEKERLRREEEERKRKDIEERRRKLEEEQKRVEEEDRKNLEEEWKRNLTDELKRREEKERLRREGEERKRREEEEKDQEVRENSSGISAYEQWSIWVNHHLSDEEKEQIRIEEEEEEERLRREEEERVRKKEEERLRREEEERKQREEEERLRREEEERKQREEEERLRREEEERRQKEEERRRREEENPKVRENNSGLNEYEQWNIWINQQLSDMDKEEMRIEEKEEEERLRREEEERKQKEEEERLRREEEERRQKEEEQKKEETPKVIRSHSWIVLPGKAAIKIIDKSAAGYNESGIPQDICFFFHAEKLKPGSQIPILLRYNGITLDGKINRDTSLQGEKTPSVRIFWDSKLKPDVNNRFDQKDENKIPVIIFTPTSKRHEYYFSLDILSSNALLDSSNNIEISHILDLMNSPDAKAKDDFRDLSFINEWNWLNYSPDLLSRFTSEVSKLSNRTAYQNYSWIIVPEKVVIKPVDKSLLTGGYLTILQKVRSFFRVDNNTAGLDEGISITIKHDGCNYEGVISSSNSTGVRIYLDKMLKFKIIEFCKHVQQGEMPYLTFTHGPTKKRFNLILSVYSQGVPKSICAALYPIPDTPESIVKFINRSRFKGKFRLGINDTMASSIAGDWMVIPDVAAIYDVSKVPTELTLPEPITTFFNMSEIVELFNGRLYLLFGDKKYECDLIPGSAFKMSTSSNSSGLLLLDSWLVRLINTRVNSISREPLTSNSGENKPILIFEKTEVESVYVVTVGRSPLNLKTYKTASEVGKEFYQSPKTLHKVILDRHQGLSRYPDEKYVRNILSPCLESDFPESAINVWNSIVKKTPKTSESKSSKTVSPLIVKDSIVSNSTKVPEPDKVSPLIVKDSIVSNSTKVPEPDKVSPLIVKDSIVSNSPKTSEPDKVSPNASDSVVSRETESVKIPKKKFVVSPPNASDSVVSRETESVKIPKKKIVVSPPNTSRHSPVKKTKITIDDLKVRRAQEDLDITQEMLKIDYGEGEECISIKESVMGKKSVESDVSTENLTDWDLFKARATKNQLAFLKLMLRSPSQISELKKIASGDKKNIDTFIEDLNYLANECTGDVVIENGCIIDEYIDSVADLFK